MEKEENAELLWAFPDVDCQHVPFGGRVIVQIKRVRKKSKGGIELLKDTKETEAANTQVAKVIALGPLAFKMRTTMEPWPEGIWAKIGDFVRVPRWGGDRWLIEVPGEDEPAEFITFNDKELISGLKPGVNPLSIRAFLL